MNIYKNISSNKKIQKGFTIVELLIVIVIIGILAALVVTTYSGIQKKARDTERKTDINALHAHAEAYQAENGKYPSLAEFNSATFRGDNMKGLDPAALKDPNDQSATPTLAAAPASNVYSYQTTPADCDNGAAGGANCTGYTFTATLESGSPYFVKQSLAN